MRALVVESPRQAVIKEVPYPKPGAGMVTIKVANVGICGTDFHVFGGDFISPYPIIPGHEFSGTIHEIGEGVTGFEVGDRVSADPNLLCGACQFCLTHRGNHCENWGALGNTVDGAMAEFVTVPAANVVKLPNTMSFEEASFIEPMACVVHGMNRLQLQVGDSVILFGAGAMGQQLVQAIAHAGASELVVVDVSQEKLDLSKQMGATKGILSKDLDGLKGDYPFGFDVVVDVTGIPSVIEKAFEFMGPTAKFLQFGVTATDANIRVNPFKVYSKDWTILGSMAVNHTLLPALKWMKGGRIKVLPLISKVISLEEAVDFLAQPKSPELLKVQIKL